MFGENIDKFKRNRKSRTSPPRSSDQFSRLRWTMKIMIKIMMSNARDNLYPFQGGEDGILFKGAKQGANTQLRILEIVCNKPQYIFWDWQNLSITQDLSNTSSTTWAGAPASCDILPFFPTFLPTRPPQYYPFHFQWKKWKWQCCGEHHKASRGGGWFQEDARLAHLTVP